MSTRSLVFAAFLAAFIAFGCPSASAVLIYSNNFDIGGDPGDPLGPEWSSNTRINRTPNLRRFLGGPDDTRFGLSNDNAVLTLSGLPDHTDVTLSFSLFVINDWVGLLSPRNMFILTSDGQTLFSTTFANGGGGTQDYPNVCTGITPNTCGALPHPGQTGASEVNTLGFGNTHNGDSVYDLTFTFAHSASTLSVDFGVTGLVGYGRLNQQSWGLDNVAVAVTPIPEPSTYAMLLAGLGLLGFVARRRTRIMAQAKNP